MEVGIFESNGVRMCVCVVVLVVVVGVLVKAKH